MSRIESPCVDVCTMDPERGLCKGCGRTLDEIAGWARFTDTQRQRIMSELPLRMRDSGLAVIVEEPNP